MGHGVPELVLELNGRTWTLDASRSYALGRDPQGDVMVNDARVSWRHATISFTGRSWVIEDHGSTNGTFVQGRRIHHMEIGPGSDVHLGSSTDGPRLNLSGAVADVPRQQSRQHQDWQEPQQDWIAQHERYGGGETPRAYGDPSTSGPDFRTGGWS